MSLGVDLGQNLSLNLALFTIKPMPVLARTAAVTLSAKLLHGLT